MKSKTYLNSSVRHGYLMRWANMPIKSYINPMKFYSKQGEDLIYRNLVVKAMEEWEKASDGLVEFELVPTLLESQLNVDWKRVDRAALGHCKYDFNYFEKCKSLYDVEVSIGLTDGLIHQQYNSEDEVYHTILHEIGHSLGLGHSPYESDIMYTPHKYGVLSLSENDKRSIQWLYSIPAGMSVSQVGKEVSVMTDTDVDMIISKILNDDSEINIEETHLIKSAQRNLLNETDNIGSVKRYNLMLQNIGISDSMKKFFIDQQRKG